MLLRGAFRFQRSIASEILPNELHGSLVHFSPSSLRLAYVQLLETGFLHADPHPGNLLRTPDGKICILDYGLMTQVGCVKLLLLWVAPR